MGMAASSDRWHNPIPPDPPAYPAECIFWTGAVVMGYGWKRHGGGKEYVHRLAANAPKGMEVHHLCGVRLCYNPDHLQVVTKQEHIAIHTELRTHCKHGHEWNEENTYVRPDTGTRQCRQCKRDRRGRNRAPG